MSDRRIRVAGPWVTEREVRYVAEAAANDWYANAGASVGRFERAFAEFLGVSHAVAVPHCTSAIHLALLALGVGPGDEVIVPDITWVATAAPIHYVGAQPVFADIDAETWCLTAETIERCLTPATKAIIVVDLYGAVPDMSEIGALAERYGIPIVEDAAQAAGAEWKSEPAGSLGAIGTFSFHGSKTLTTGEGGLLATDDSAVHERVLFLRDHGRPVGAHHTFMSTEIGYKYRMSSLQAAFGLAQLERIDELVGRKREIFRWYSERLAEVSGVSLNVEAAGTLNSYWMVTAVLSADYGLSASDVMEHLLEDEIETRPFFHPLSALPAFQNVPDAPLAHERNTVSYDISPRGINLPSALILTESDVDRVCSRLIALLATRRPA
jgi:perosamine synthetase